MDSSVSTPTRGQALAEFALVFPVMFVIVAAIIQFGIIFWAQNTLTQIARDTGRWASTQVTCPTTATVTGTANAIAQSSSLIGYQGPADLSVVAATSGAHCPPTSNADITYVTITLRHQVPVFFPFIPGDGNLSTSAQFRMEPRP